MQTAFATLRLVIHELVLVEHQVAKVIGLKLSESLLWLAGRQADKREAQSLGSGLCI